MERGLIWLPLLVLFFWLAWSGWNEYQKVESYRIWSEQFDKAKYDIYAVLGKKETEITWGKPTRKGLINLQTFSLKDVESIRLLVGDRPVDLAKLPSKGLAVIEFIFKDNNSSIKIPFTEIELAAKWQQYLQQEV
ncbi:MAG: hypothetical protein ACRC2R_23500 [Xenococcaceae cyanobacterium]